MIRIKGKAAPDVVFLDDVNEKVTIDDYSQVTGKTSDPSKEKRGHTLVRGQLTDMYMNLLQNSPEIGPLLVRLYDRHKLHNLTSSSGENTRAELATIMTDLLSMDLQPTESELITDVLIGLLNKAEVDLRSALADRLSTMGGVPLRMVLHLANDEIDVAESVLKDSEVLTDTDLIYIIRGKSNDHWQAIAERTEMSDGLIDALVDTKDLSTAITLSENKNIVLTKHAVNRFTHMSRHSDDLAKPFIMRNEVPNTVVTKLYQHVGIALKKFIRDEFAAVDLDAVDTAIDDVVFQASLPEGANLTPTVDLMIMAENMMEKGFLTPDVMIDGLRRGQVITFVAQFSVYCGLLEQTVREMLAQKSAQGLAIACKAMGIQKPEFVNMFLLTHRFRSSGERVINKDELGLALKYYDKITERMAREILNESRH
ncbi:MAG: DUF2336 domain-containing protein [Alphaproteobacteria bacterium]|nr:DUF2336 domain-containing protein [Alphaproteobacteria bacterium]